MTEKLLTRDEAYRAMQEGKKIAHSSFAYKEFLHMPDSVVRDEEGYDFTDGWLIRCGGVWEKNWRLYK